MTKSPVTFENVKDSEKPINKQKSRLFIGYNFLLFARKTQVFQDILRNK